jgi:hypothetical protein
MKCMGNGIGCLILAIKKPDKVSIEDMRAMLQTIVDYEL